jgi:hypothetical protein
VNVVRAVPGEGFVWADAVVVDPVALDVRGEVHDVVDLLEDSRSDSVTPTHARGTRSAPACPCRCRRGPDKVRPAKSCNGVGGDLGPGGANELVEPPGFAIPGELQQVNQRHGLEHMCAYRVHPLALRPILEADQRLPVAAAPEPGVSSAS